MLAVTLFVLQPVESISADNLIKLCLIYRQELYCRSYDLRKRYTVILVDAKMREQSQSLSLVEEPELYLEPSVWEGLRDGLYWLVWEKYTNHPEYPSNCMENVAMRSNHPQHLHWRST